MQQESEIGWLIRYTLDFNQVSLDVEWALFEYIYVYLELSVDLCTTGGRRR
jgi:hypothetical protein